MSFTKEVAYARFTPGAGAVTTNVAVKCVVSRTADGDYTVTLDDAIAANFCVIDCSVDATAGGGVGTARIPNWVHTSETAKRIQIRDDAGALALPVAVTVRFSRVSPIQ